MSIEKSSNFTSDMSVIVSRPVFSETTVYMMSVVISLERVHSFKHYPCLQTRQHTRSYTQYLAFEVLVKTDRRIRGDMFQCLILVSKHRAISAMTNRVNNMSA